MKKSRRKPRGKNRFFRNPAPFSLAIVNPSKRRKKRRNPLTKRKATARPMSRPRVKKKISRKRSRRKNPFQLKHVLVETPTQNPSKKSAMKHRKHRKRSRNPVRTSTRGRSSRRRHRNPARRRGLFRRMRNPVAILSDVATKENITQGAGVLVGIVGTRWLVNTLLQGDPTTGQRMFDLPGITYSTAAAPLTQAQFVEKNKIALAFYETAIPAIVGYFMRNQNKAFSAGLLNASVVNAGIALVRGSKVGQTAGLGAFLPRQKAMNTFIPGVPPMLSGPASAFVQNGSPVPRGAGAVVNRSWMNSTTGGGPDPFRST